ncbi:NAD(P)H-dependent oxidoreductase [Parvibaculum sp.]|jgi:NAD(P)H dehydrogenase (quinone)|uniref:NAD(P)H-dependent oxidoreductase n=1 Tax=Parvibaculum sp. TaxID=2024848 RepID=UPI0032970F16
MRVLVVYCHPKPDSYVAAMCDAVLEGLDQAGHETELVDLYADDFDPRFSAEEHETYEDPTSNGKGLEHYKEKLRSADGIVFVFPTWWYDMPAMLKGWLDRVWVPGTAFDLGDGGKAIQPRLQNIRFMGGVTSCGASWWWSKLVGEPHRRILMRGMRALCGKDCRQVWLGCYQMDTSTQKKRTNFLSTIRRRMARVA